MKYATQAALMCAVAGLAACQDGVEFQSGVASKLRVAGGEYHTGTFPGLDGDASVAVEDAGDTSADAGDAGPSGPPEVDSIASPNNSILLGTQSKAISALVHPSTRTVAIALEGEPGYWKLPVTQPSIENAPDLEVNAALGFDRMLGAGPARLLIAAANAAGEYGHGRSLDVQLVDPTPVASLVVALTWSSDMDLDLLVRLPDGSLLTPSNFSDSTGRRIAPGEDVPSIDIDSNQACLIDGVRQENAVFTAPQAGKYEVFVRLAAACGLPSAGWKVRILRDGVDNGSVSGATNAWEADVKNGGPEGPGRFAVRFSVSD